MRLVRLLREYTAYKYLSNTFLYYQIHCAAQSMHMAHTQHNNTCTQTKYIHTGVLIIPKLVGSATSDGLTGPPIGCSFGTGP